MMNHLTVVLGFIAVVTLGPLNAYCETYTQTIDFDSNQAYSWNTNWKHSLSQIPQGYKIESGEITLGVRVWYWGWNIYEQNIDLMASDTASFVLPDNRTCEFNPSTNPNPNNFYTVTCPFSSSEVEFIANDNEIHIGTNTYGGTYYLDFSTVAVSAVSAEAADVSVNSKVNGSFGFHPDGSNLSAGSDMVPGFVFEKPMTVSITASGVVNLLPEVASSLNNVSPDGVNFNGDSFGLTRELDLGYLPLEEATVDTGAANFPEDFPNTLPDTGALIGAFVPKTKIISSGFAARDEDTGVLGISSDQLFIIGSGPFNFKATQAGTLFLGINDNRPLNNTGDFQVSISVVRKVADPVEALISIINSLLLEE